MNQAKASTFRVLLAAIFVGGCTGLPEGDPAVPETLAIRGGERTDANAAIGLLKRAVAPAMTCTATLIHARYILTAAHCFGHVEDFPERYRFAFVSATAGPTEVGLERLRIFGKHGGGVERFQGGELIPPISPGTTPDRHGKDDLAVARLDRDIASEEAWPLGLAVELPADGDTVTVFGFGCTSLDGSGSTEKRARSFSYRRAPNRSGGQEVGALCSGDSGGPAVIGTGEGLDPIWGVNSGTSGPVDFYGNAVWYRDAIAEAMREMDGTAWNQGVWRGGRQLETIPLQPGEGADRCRDHCWGREACRAYTVLGSDGGERTCSLLDVPDAWRPSPGSDSGLGNPGFELNVDRRGKEFETEAVSDVGECRRLCATRPTCRAFTLAPVSPERPTPLCHLIPYAPSKVTRKTSPYVSAVKRGLEWNINRPGMDIGDGWTMFPNWPARGTPEGCQALCAAHEPCAAFTFVEAARTGNGSSFARCFLKSGVPEPQWQPRQGLVSGVKGGEL